MKKVSVIIPVYNGEKFIIECYNSIKKQTYSNLEIIFINDGSIDNSSKILNDLAKKDEKIRIIDKKNEGVSIARNKGLDVALGEYITFLDVDDMFEKDYIEIMVNTLEKNNLDIIKTGFTMFNENEFEKIRCFDTNYKEIFLSDINKTFTETTKFNSSCMQLIKLNIINKYNIRFNEKLRYAEDFLFTFNCFTHSKKIAWINNTGYLVRDNINSCSRTRNFEAQYKNVLDTLEAFQVLYDNNDKNRVSNKIIMTMISQFKLADLKKIKFMYFKEKINYIYTLKEWKIVKDNFKVYSGNFINKVFVKALITKRLRLLYFALKLYSIIKLKK